jgi:hypothetical protein
MFVPLKVMLVGETVPVGTATPVPVSVAVCVEPATVLALSVTVTVAVREPEADGVNVTEIVQLVPVARVEPQLLF